MFCNGHKIYVGSGLKNCENYDEAFAKSNDILDYEYKIFLKICQSLDVEFSKATVIIAHPQRIQFLGIFANVPWCEHCINPDPYFNVSYDHVYLGLHPHIDMYYCLKRIIYWAEHKQLKVYINIKVPEEPDELFNPYENYSMEKYLNLEQFKSLLSYGINNQYVSFSNLILPYLECENDVSQARKYWEYYKLYTLGYRLEIHGIIIYSQNLIEKYNKLGLYDMQDLLISVLSFHDYDDSFMLRRNNTIERTKYVEKSIQRYRDLLRKVTVKEILNDINSVHRKNSSVDALDNSINDIILSYVYEKYTE